MAQLEDMRIQNRNAFQLSALDSAFIERYLEEYYAKMREGQGEDDAMEIGDNLRCSEEFIDDSAE